ncbi:MAG: DNA repair protein RecN [Lachnospiraceae bacterium]|nr:DNA repair protein RecN [Lachnospiraceae bacterium]
MLLNLHVKNFALIDECEVDFGDGLNILTGETGAGKSIIIGSVNAALGARVSKDVVRSDNSPAIVELVFETKGTKVNDVLREMDITCDDNVIISRKIQSSRSICKINGETVSSAQVKRIAELLIDIHGQHEHQSLLNPAKHLEILDEFGGDDILSIREEVAKHYKEYMEYKEELDNTSMDDETRRREISFLEYEIKEIEDANLSEGEDETVEADYKRMANSMKITENLSEVYGITGGSSGARGIDDSIGEAIRRLSAVTEYDPGLTELLEMLENIEGLTSDFNREIAGYLSDNEFDEAVFAETESRLDLINNLKAKYGNTIELIGKALSERKAKLESLNNLEEHVADLENKLRLAEKVLSEKSEALHKARVDAGAALKEKICQALQELNFLQVEFEIDFREKAFSAKGKDEVHFLISTNPGEPVRELSGVASGGELSRIMLALKTIMAENDKIPTLIFDEIDTGISGRTAQKVSEKLNLVSRGHQVICITHLPQIASMADEHFLIEKKVENSSTVSLIEKLSEEESVREIARMLGGAEITEAVLANAREMKDLAGKKLL